MDCCNKQRQKQGLVQQHTASVPNSSSVAIRTVTDLAVYHFLGFLQQTKTRTRIAATHRTPSPLFQCSRQHSRKNRLLLQNTRRCRRYSCPWCPQCLPCSCRHTCWQQLGQTEAKTKTGFCIAMFTAVRESLTSQQNTGEVIQLKGNKTSTYIHGTSRICGSPRLAFSLESWDFNKYTSQRIKHLGSGPAVSVQAAFNYVAKSMACSQSCDA